MAETTCNNRRQSRRPPKNRHRRHPPELRPERAAAPTPADAHPRHTHRDPEDHKVTSPRRADRLPRSQGHQRRSTTFAHDTIVTRRASQIGPPAQHPRSTRRNAQNESSSDTSHAEISTPNGYQYSLRLTMQTAEIPHQWNQSIEYRDQWRSRAIATTVARPPCTRSAVSTTPATDCSRAHNMVLGNRTNGQ